MPDTRKMRMVLDFEFKDGDDGHASHAELNISCTTVDGLEFKSSFSEQDRSDALASKSLLRSDHVVSALRSLAQAGAQTSKDKGVVVDSSIAAPVVPKEATVEPPPEEPKDTGEDQFAEERRKYMDNLRKQLQDMKYGEIRKMVTDSGLGVSFSNKTPRDQVIEKVMDAVDKIDRRKNPLS